MPFLTPSATGERDIALTFLKQQFDQVRSTTYGLGVDELGANPSASSFSLGSLLKHLTQVAHHWGSVAAAAPDRPPEDGAPQDTELTPQDTSESLLAAYDEAVDFAMTSFSTADLEASAPIPDAPWYPKDLPPWQVRWTLAQLITEVARHAGHADIIRESLDGKVSYELNARADGQPWPPQWS